MNRTIEIVDRVFFVVLLATVSLAFFGLLRHFIQPIFWAVTLAVLFQGLNEEFAARLGQRRTPAALLTLVVLVFAVIMPLMLIGISVTQEAARLVNDLEAGEIDLGQALSWTQAQLPQLFDYVRNAGFDSERLLAGISSSAVIAGQWLATNAVDLGMNAMVFTLMFGVMLYLLFFFLRDGRSILRRILNALPLGAVNSVQLVDRFTSVVRATIRGNFIIGAIQGTLGGLAFALLGIRAPVLWGVVMVGFSLLPAVGPAVVWAPAAVILLVAGEYVKGTILIIVGSVIIGLVDNLLRPRLVGRDARMPDYLVLVATLGGLWAFGISGFVLGPVIAALFVTMWSGLKDATQPAD